jgi:4-hydroxy-tetrahydrodipicolinate reductase
MSLKNRKIKLGLFGSSGKMGKSVEQILKNGSDSFEPYLAVGKQSSEVFAITAIDLNDVESEILEDVEVWIDFSSKEGLKELFSSTDKQKTAIVSGSTGFDEKDFSKLKKQSKGRAFFWASNLSPGLWAFRQALKSFSHISDFDFAIEEIHHSKKKDKPSGTAKTLRSDLEQIIQKKIDEPTALRLGGVFGVHNVIAASSNEVISFQHQALNRSVFAEGALKAAIWVVGKKNGFYSMDDIFLN